jgi:hypothetical protein
MINLNLWDKECVEHLISMFMPDGIEKIEQKNSVVEIIYNFHFSSFGLDMAHIMKNPMMESKYFNLVEMLSEKNYSKFAETLNEEQCLLHPLVVDFRLRKLIDKCKDLDHATDPRHYYGR